jgi:SAM-dependent methyltransferase
VTQATPGRVVERIEMTRSELETIEHDILRRRHVERYAIIRQFVYGRVVDCACGVGYGTWLLAKNPDVQHAYGVDVDADAIDAARREFTSPKIEFLQGDLASTNLDAIDVLVSLETIEHLPDPAELVRFAERAGAREVIVSFPSKKTTHYNPHHLWDLATSDIVDLFAASYVPIRTFDYTFDTTFVHLAVLNRRGAALKRYRFKA